MLEKKNQNIMIIDLPMFAVITEGFKLVTIAFPELITNKIVSENITNNN